MNGQEIVVGVISDTHGLLRPEALNALEGSNLIVHAGDVGKPEILESLREIAPVVAVRGNIDTEAWADELPTWETVEVGSTWLYVLHNLQELDLDPAAGGFHVVISGHTHQPLIEQRRDVLYLNPGSAGPRRFRLPISVARLYIHGTSIDARLIELPLKG